jgi:hypothetical protein
MHRARGKSGRSKDMWKREVRSGEVNAEKLKTES